MRQGAPLVSRIRGGAPAWLAALCVLAGTPAGAEGQDASPVAAASKHMDVEAMGGGTVVLD